MQRAIRAARRNVARRFVFGARLLRQEQTSIDRKDADHGHRERGRDRIEHERDAIPFGAKHLRQLGRHGQRMHRPVAGSHLHGQRLQHRRECGRVALQLVRTAADRQDFAARHPRHFGIHPTDIPADHVVHRISAVRVRANQPASASAVGSVPRLAFGSVHDPQVKSRRTRPCK